ncbi:hypothetical protein, partial [Amycolatopsis sp.]|uniref:hypothetical protein n=1 Tax=Amycolatopsis sp. TaxID=37632 RepID=UPI002D7E1CA3
MAALTNFTDRVARWLLPPELPSAPEYVPPALSAAAITPPPAGPYQPVSQRAPKPVEWQTRAWDFYRHCGEARQAVDWIANTPAPASRLLMSA